VSGWYPLDDYTALLEAYIREVDGGDPRALIERAEKVLERQLGGVHRLFIRLGSPESLVRKVAAAQATYFRGSEVSVVSCGKGRALVRYLGFARNHQPIEHAIVAFYRKGLKLAGAQDVQARFTVSMALGTGVSETELTWS
jgi:hypothetical protein